MDFQLLYSKLLFSACAPQDRPPTPGEQKRRQLDFEQDRLSALERNVTVLRQQKDQQERLAGLPGLSRMKSTQTEIENLSGRLSDLRADATDLRETAANALQSRILAGESARSQIDSRIQSLAQSRRTLQMDIDLERLNPNGTPEQRERINQMAQLSNTQRLQIDELQAQKSNFPAALSAQAGAIAAVARAQNDDLVADQTAIRERIESLRNDVARLQVDRERARMSLMSIDQQLAGAELAYADQLKRVRALQGSANP